MKHIKIFEEFDKHNYDLDVIKSCFVKLEDEKFRIEIEVGYLKFVRPIKKNRYYFRERHYTKDVKNGIKITITKNSSSLLFPPITITDEMKDILEVSSDYLQDKYNLRLDYINVVTVTPRVGSYDKKTFDSFDEIDKDLEASSLYLHFRPANTIDKVKTYIKSKL